MCMYSNSPFMVTKPLVPFVRRVGRVGERCQVTV